MQADFRHGLLSRTPAPRAPGEARLGAQAMARPLAEDVVAGALDGVEDRPAPEPGQAHLEAEVAADPVAQRAAGEEQVARALDQVLHQGPELRADAGRVQVPLLHPVPLAQLAGRVDPPA